jgi:hypothetical protein
MFLLRCPNCKNQMKCNPKGNVLSGKSKRCVYCGKSFSVKNNIIQQI